MGIADEHARGDRPPRRHGTVAVFVVVLVACLESVVSLAVATQ
jgi:hypothetical protein